MQLNQTPRGVFAFWPLKYVKMNFLENKFYSQGKRENFTRHAVKMELGVKHLDYDISWHPFLDIQCNISRDTTLCQSNNQQKINQ